MDPHALWEVWWQFKKWKFKNTDFVSLGKLVTKMDFLQDWYQNDPCGLRNGFDLNTQNGPNKGSQQGR